MEKIIMLVDDEPKIVEMFSTVFQNSGYTVLSAGDGESALRLLKSVPRLPQVAFLDLNMPGMNGVELCAEIRKQWPWIISIAVTGYASIFELAACREAGFEDYYTKPVQVSELVETANQAMKKVERWRSRQHIKS